MGISKKVAALVATMCAVATMQVGLGIAEPASGAAANVMKIKTISTKTAPYKKRIRVRPSYARSGQVVVDAAVLTVSKGSKVVANKKTSVALGPGTYKVRQTVRYRTYAVKTRQATLYEEGSFFDSYDHFDGSIECIVASVDELGTEVAATCTVSEYDTEEQRSWENIATSAVLDQQRSVWVLDGGVDVPNYSGFSPEIGNVFGLESMLLSENLTAPQRYRTYSKAKRIEKRQTLTVKAGKKPRTCATYADFKRVAYDFSEPRVYGDSKSRVAQILHNGGTRSSYADYGDQVLEFRTYRTCDSSASMYVGFENGYSFAY